MVNTIGNLVKITLLGLKGDLGYAVDLNDSTLIEQPLISNFIFANSFIVKIYQKKLTSRYGLFYTGAMKEKYLV